MARLFAAILLLCWHSPGRSEETPAPAELSPTAEAAAPATPAATPSAAPSAAEEARVEEAVGQEADAYVVTGSRSEMLRRRLPQRIDVVNAAQIERAQAADLTDILKRSTNVEVLQYPGALTGIGIRGFSPEFPALSKKTLLLIDGHPTASANLASVNLDSIERIEVFKGPGSALYGTDAMGGVINVIRRRNRGPLRAKAVLGLGSYDSHLANLGVGGGIFDWLDFDASAALKDQNQPYKTGEDHETTYKFSDYRKTSGNLRLGLGLPGGWRLDSSLSGVNDNVGTSDDVFFNRQNRGYKKVKQYEFDATLGGALLGSELSLTYYLSREVLVTSATITFTATPVSYPSFGSDYRWEGLQVKDVIPAFGQQIVLGWDYRNAAATSQSWTTPVSGPDYQDFKRKAPFSPDTGQETWGIYGQGNLNLFGEKLTGNIGGRYDSFRLELRETAYKATGFSPGSSSSGNFSPSAGLKFAPLPQFNVHASGGTAYKVPSAVQLAGSTVSGSITFVGNPDLRPERSASWDAGFGLEFRRLGFRSDLTYYSSDVRDFINPKVVNATTSSYENVTDTVLIQGLEAEVSEDLGALLGWASSLRLFGNINRIFRAAKELPSAKYEDLRLVSPARVNYGVEFDDRVRFNASVTARHVEPVQDLDFNKPFPYPTVFYPTVDVVDLAFGFKTVRDQRLDLGVQNVLDKFYYEKLGFPFAGRTFLARYSYQFNL